MKRYEYDAVLHEEADGGAYVIFPRRTGASAMSSAS